MNSDKKNSTKSSLTSQSSQSNKQWLKILPFLVIIIFIFGLSSYFIFETLTRNIESDTIPNLIKFILIFGIFLIISAFASTHTAYKKQLRYLSLLGYIWLGTFHILFFTCLFDFISQFIFPNENSQWIILFTLFASLWSLYKGFKKPTLITHPLEIPSKNLDPLKELSLVQISDLHIGMLHLDAVWLLKIIERINSLNPHIVVITGDLIEGPFSEVSPQLENLKNLNAQHKYYITGNHEYIHSIRSAKNNETVNQEAINQLNLNQTSWDIWEKRLQELGFTVLHNSHEIIDFHSLKIMIAGVPDRMANRFYKNLNSLPDKALHTDQPTDYKILLAHEPSSVFDLKNEKCDILLSGHTHGGQIFPFALLVRLVQPVVSGFKRTQSTLVFAHQGTGFWGPPMRWFSRSEIVLFKWKSK